jgi:hypothetical protein
LAFFFFLSQFGTIHLAHERLQMKCFILKEKYTKLISHNHSELHLLSCFYMSDWSMLEKDETLINIFFKHKVLGSVGCGLILIYFFSLIGLWPKLVLCTLTLLLHLIITSIFQMNSSQWWWGPTWCSEDWFLLTLRNPIWLTSWSDLPCPAAACTYSHPVHRNSTHGSSQSAAPPALML